MPNALRGNILKILLHTSSVNSLARESLRKLLQFASSAALQNAKHTWSKEPFRSNLWSTSGSLGRLACLGPKRNQLLSRVSVWLFWSEITVFTSAHTNQTKEETESDSHLSRLKSAGEKRRCENTHGHLNHLPLFLPRV